VQGSAVADKGERCAASRRTAKFKNVHVTITMPVYGVIIIIIIGLLRKNAA